MRRIRGGRGREGKGNKEEVGRLQRNRIKGEEKGRQRGRLEDIYIRGKKEQLGREGG